MADKQQLESWFYELGMNRSALPYELVRVFSGSESSEISASIALAFLGT